MFLICNSDETPNGFEHAYSEKEGERKEENILRQCNVLFDEL